MTPSDRAIQWCIRRHALLSLTQIDLHNRGQCCSECEDVRELIEEAYETAAIEAEAEQCWEVATSIRELKEKP